MEERTELCPVCKGWGTKELPITKTYVTCDYCGGDSMQLITSDYYVSWDIPPYIEYGVRRKNLLKKRLYLVLVVFMILIALFLLMFLVNILS
jgi:hypothetical protein